MLSREIYFLRLKSVITFSGKPIFDEISIAHLQVNQEVQEYLIGYRHEILLPFL